jgi:hypothetical protein
MPGCGMHREVARCEVHIDAVDLGVPRSASGRFDKSFMSAAKILCENRYKTMIILTRGLGIR